MFAILTPKDTKLSHKKFPSKVGPPDTVAYHLFMIQNIRVSGGQLFPGGGGSEQMFQSALYPDFTPSHPPPCNTVHLPRPAANP